MIVTDPKVYWKRRMENVKHHVRIGAVLMRYGVEVTEGRAQSPIQCRFHGVDRNPSAIAYAETDSVHCFRCKQSWDVVSYVRQSENVGFAQAIALLESWYNVPRLPDRLDEAAAAHAVDDVWEGRVRLDGAPEDPGIDAFRGAYDSLGRLVLSLRDDLGMEAFLEAFWVADNLAWDVKTGTVGAEKATEVIRRLRERVRSGAQERP